MFKVIIAALALTVSASFNTASAAGKNKKDKKQVKTEQTAAPLKLTTSTDTLSFASGKVRTEGLLPFLKQQYGIDESQMADFIRGYEDAVKSGISPKLKAYSAGQQIAVMTGERMLPFIKEEFKNRPDSISDALFYQGFISSLKKDDTQLTDSLAKVIFEREFKKAKTERDEANRKAGEDFLAQNAKKEGVVTLPSGLQYKVITKGTGAVATADDEVTVKYEGRLIDGTVFDSSYKRPGETSKFRPDQVIKGWTEALTMMPVGSKWELYIPQNLAYGERQAGQIKPYSALVFTVELVSIDKPKAAETAKPAAKTTPAKVKKVTPKKKK